MRTQLGGLCILVSGLALALPDETNAQRPDPDQIAAHCVRSVKQLSDRCVEANADTARDCIRKIKRLLEAGERHEAAHVARRCVHRIHLQSDNCVEAIHEHCRRCIDVLTELGAHELARHVRQACLRSIDRVRDSERRAVHAIGELFGE